MKLFAKPYTVIITEFSASFR